MKFYSYMLNEIECTISLADGVSETILPSLLPAGYTNLKEVPADYQPYSPPPAEAVAGMVMPPEVRNYNNSQSVELSAPIKAVVEAMVLKKDGTFMLLQAVDFNFSGNIFTVVTPTLGLGDKVKVTYTI